MSHNMQDSTNKNPHFLCPHCLLKLSTYVTQLYVPIVRRTKNQLFHQSAVENDFFRQFFPKVFVSVWEFWYAVDMFYVSCSPPAFCKDSFNLQELYTFLFASQPRSFDSLLA